MFESYTDFGNLLEKARIDNWYYLLETKTGQQFIFGSIEVIDDEWITLQPLDDGLSDTGDMLPFDGPKNDPCVVGERGIMMRLDAIAWVADGTS